MLAWVNGTFVEDSEAVVPIRDRGFLLGDGIFETWRTYGGRQVRHMVERHLRRLHRSIRYMELPADEIVAEIETVTTELAERNHDAFVAAGDVVMHTVVTRGQTRKSIEGFDPGTPTRVVMCNPIPLHAYGAVIETGVHLVPSAFGPNPFMAHDPRVKSISRLAYTRGERKEARAGTGNWAIVIDRDGFVTEAVGAAICIVEGETIVRTPPWMRLESVSLDVFSELGEQLGFRVTDRPLTVFDLLNADETYVLQTSVAFLPVADLDGIPLRRNGVVGDAIRKAWIELVGFDYVEQGRRAAAAAAAAG